MDRITTTLTAPGERAVKRNGKYIGMIVRDREGWGYGHTSRTPHFRTFTEAAHSLSAIR